MSQNTPNNPANRLYYWDGVQVTQQQYKEHLKARVQKVDNYMTFLSNGQSQWRRREARKEYFRTRHNKR